MSRTVRVGFCGTGGIAGAHIQNLRRLVGVDIVALHDIDDGRAESVRHDLALAPDATVPPRTPSTGSAIARMGVTTPRSMNPTVYPDLTTMLASANLDALYICLPPFAHGEQEIMAARSGIHLYVEKPQALSLDLAHRVAQEIDRAGVITSVGYQLRYRPSVQAVLQRMRGIPVGMVMGMWLGGLPHTPWWRHMEQSGGQLVEQATHTIDMMRYIVGEIDSVYANYALRTLGDVPDMNIPDVTALTLHFANGAIGTLNATCMLNWGMGETLNGLHIVARDMLIHLDNNSATIKQNARTETISDDGFESMLEADAAFLHAVAIGRAEGILSSYADGLHSLAVTLAANASETAGQPVRVNNDPADMRAGQ